MMRQEESEPVCIVNGCGRTRVHRVGECAPDDAPTYSDGAEVQALVDAALTGQLTDDEWTDLDYIVHERSFRLDEARMFALAEAVERIVAVRMSAAVKQAQADERARIAQAIEEQVIVGPVGPYAATWNDGCRAAAWIARGAVL